MTKPPVFILGARSDIGKATAHAFAALGHPIQLAARRTEILDADRSDSALRHNVEVTLHEFDTLELSSHSAFLDQLPELPEIAICAVGLMGEQSENERNIDAASCVMRSNYEGPASILAVLANRFDDHDHRTLVGISFGAGERARATNYVYGSTKAGFTAFLSGHRNRLAKKGVHVVTILAGFVATQMTKGLDLPAKLTAKPEEAGQAITRASLRKRISSTCGRSGGLQ